MDDLTDIRNELTMNGLTWNVYVYQDGTRHKWYRSMTDAEVEDRSNGLWNTVEEVDAEMASPPDYPRFEIEIVQNSDESYEVSASATRFHVGSVFMTDSIGGEYHVETQTLDKAIIVVREFANSLS